MINCSCSILDWRDVGNMISIEKHLRTKKKHDQWSSLEVTNIYWSMTSCALWHELAICNSKDDGYGCWILSDANKIHHFFFFSERSSTKNTYKSISKICRMDFLTKTNLTNLSLSSLTVFLFFHLFGDLYFSW